MEESPLRDELAAHSRGPRRPRALGRPSVERALPRRATSCACAKRWRAPKPHKGVSLSARSALLRALRDELHPSAPDSRADRRRARGRAAAVRPARRSRSTGLLGGGGSAPRASPRREKLDLRARSTRTRAHRDRFTQGPLQQGVRLPHRGHQGEPQARAERLHRASRRSRAASASSPRSSRSTRRSSRRGGAAVRARGRAFRRAGRGGREHRSAHRLRRRGLSRSSTRYGRSPRLVPTGATCRPMRRRFGRPRDPEGRHPVVERTLAARPLRAERHAISIRSARRSWCSPVRTWPASPPTCGRSR